MGVAHLEVSSNNLNSSHKGQRGEGDGMGLRGVSKCRSYMESAFSIIEKPK